MLMLLMLLMLLNSCYRTLLPIHWFPPPPLDQANEQLGTWVVRVVREWERGQASLGALWTGSYPSPVALGLGGGGLPGLRLAF